MGTKWLGRGMHPTGAQVIVTIYMGGAESEVEEWVRADLNWVSRSKKSITKGRVLNVRHSLIILNKLSICGRAWFQCDPPAEVFASWFVCLALHERAAKPLGNGLGTVKTCSAMLTGLWVLCASKFGLSKSSRLTKPGPKALPAALLGKISSNSLSECGKDLEDRYQHLEIELIMALSLSKFV